MPDTSILTTLAPYHFIAYGTLLGSSIFQSFIAGPIAFKALPRPQFSTLQSAIFPIYFSLQSALPIVLAFTYPSLKSSSATPLLGGKAAAAGGITGFMAEENRWSAAVPIAACCAANVVNLVWAGPKTTEIMKVRKHQETRDGKKAYDAPPHSKEMQRLNKNFSRMHGVSASLNLAALVMTVFYGIVLSDRLQ
ncbi:MAG: hypothetical protein L6R40_001087 [Gallowayella cf. fulva]|nr:MAG: hypothetical protein L6R40_001087 [Xanthomendoza cf. fulva]